MDVKSQDMQMTQKLPTKVTLLFIRSCQSTNQSLHACPSVHLRTNMRLVAFYNITHVQLIVSENEGDGQDWTHMVLN